MSLLFFRTGVSFFLGLFISHQFVSTLNLQEKLVSPV